MPSFQEKLQKKLDDYAKVYRIDELNDANDRSTLEIMLKTEVMIDDLQQQIQDLMDENPVEQANSIKKLHDLLRDASNMIVTYQKTLAIDRKTRKTEETASVADYIRTLKRDAKEFMQQRIIRVYCNDCKVMVGRIFPVHDHTAFACSFECSQCHKLIRARREQRDVLFDVKDANWRRAYKPEIIQARKEKYHIADENELVLDGSTLEIVADDAPELERITPEEDIILGADDGTDT